MIIFNNNKIIGSLMFDNILDMDDVTISIKGFIVCISSDNSNLKNDINKLKEINNLVVTDIVTEKDNTKIYMDMPKEFKGTTIIELLNIIETLKKRIGYKLNEIGLTNYELQFQ